MNDLSLAGASPWVVCFDMEGISPNGSMGDSMVASAEKGGRAILEAVMDGCDRRAVRADGRPPYRRAGRAERLAVHVPKLSAQGRAGRRISQGESARS